MNEVDMKNFKKVIYEIVLCEDDYFKKLYDFDEEETNKRKKQYNYICKFINSFNSSNYNFYFTINENLKYFNLNINLNNNSYNILLKYFVFKGKKEFESFLKSLFVDKKAFNKNKLEFLMNQNNEHNKMLYRITNPTTNRPFRYYAISKNDLLNTLNLMFPNYEGLNIEHIKDL